jgi:hypothetical protein
MAFFLLPMELLKGCMPESLLQAAWRSWAGIGGLGFQSPSMGPPAPIKTNLCLFQSRQTFFDLLVNGRKEDL